MYHFNGHCPHQSRSKMLLYCCINLRRQLPMANGKQNLWHLAARCDIICSFSQSQSFVSHEKWVFTKGISTQRLSIITQFYKISSQDKGLFTASEVNFGEISSRLNAKLRNKSFFRTMGTTLPLSIRVLKSHNLRLQPRGKRPQPRMRLEPLLVMDTIEYGSM